MNKETLLSEILNLKEKLGKYPSQKDILVRLSLSKEELESFGGIPQLKKELGMEKNKPHSFTEEQLVSELQRVFEEVQRPLTTLTFLTNSKVCPDLISYFFKGWAKACNKAGIPYGGNAHGRVRVYIQKLVTSIAEEIFESPCLQEVSFENLISPKGRKLRYDFAIPQEHILIEIDGWTHRSKNEYERIFKGSFDYRKMLDDLKNEYAEKNNFLLLRIPHEKVSIPYLSNLFQRVQGKSRELLEHSTKTLEGYNMARNGECDKLENFQEVNNQQPSPCSEKMGKVQRLGLNLRDGKASYGDNSRQRGNGFLIEELQKILPYEKMFDLYSELNISSGILCKWKKDLKTM